MQKGSVYILQSQKSNRYYIGSSIDVARRIEQHNNGRVIATKGKGPWILVFKQEYTSVTDARKIEIKLKKLKSRDYIEKIVSDGYIKII